jgi:hypothetical protein
MRQGEALARRARRQQELPRTARQAQGQRRHVARHQPHHVADRQHRGHRAARRVDPQRDVLAGILARQREHLGRQHRPVVVVEHAVEDQNPLAEEPFAEPVVEQRLPLVVRHVPTMPPPRLRSPVSLL